MYRLVVLYTLIIATLLVGRPYVRHKQRGQDELSMSALDCRHPSSVQSGLLQTICKTPEQHEEAKTSESVLLLQRATTRVLPAVRCEKRITRLMQVCGSFSHSKIMEPLDVQVPTAISPEECERAVKRLVYVKEDGNSLQIDLNRSYSYKYVEHGKLTVSVNNVACKGSKILIHGEEHSSIVSLVTAEITFKTVRLEVNLSLQQIVDLDSNVPLSRACLRDTACIDGTSAYAIEQVKNECDLHVIRKLDMVRVQVQTEQGMRKALVSHEHKIFLEIKGQEAAGKGCEPLYAVQTTNYPELKIITAESAAVPMPSISAHLTATDVNIDLEIRSSEEYLAYRFETLIQNQIAKMGEKLCNLNSHGITRVEMSPFHQNSLLRVLGDVIQELTCAPVRVQVRIGEKRDEKCYSEALPVWLNNQPVWISALNHLVIEVSELEAMPCESIYSPLFATDNNTIVHANPTVSVVDLPLTHFDTGYLHVHEHNIVHQEFSGDLVYTSAEIQKFNDLIHFESQKSKVLSALTSKYCTRGQCGSYRPSAGTSTFSLSNLEDQIEDQIEIWPHVKEIVQEYGAYASFLVLFYICFTVLLKIGTVLHLKFKKKVSFNNAIRYTFYLDTHVRNAVLNPSSNMDTAVPNSTTPNRTGVPSTHGESEDMCMYENIPKSVSTAVVPYRRTAHEHVQQQSTPWH